MKHIDRLQTRVLDFHRREEKEQVEKEAKRKNADASEEEAPPQPPKMMPRGLYLWGPPGSGKSMCMDMLHDSFNDGSIPRRRVHFHAFMQEMHLRIHRWKHRPIVESSEESNSRDPGEADAITAIAREVASESRLLCFDEFQVTDVADALILGRILRTLFASGTILVATSNTPPSNLYAGGLNHRDFLPTIELIQRHLKVRSIDDETDHRLVSGDGRGNVYFRSGDKLDDVVRHEAQADDEEGDAQVWRSVAVPTSFGRTVRVPRTRNGIADYTFQELCANRSDTGPADYQALCEHFHTVVVRDVPLLSAEGPARHNEARRFITLIDQLYDAGLRLICSAAAEPFELFASDRGSVSSLQTNEDDTETGAAKLTGRCFQHRYTDPAAMVGPTEAELPSVTELRVAFGRAASRLVEMSGTEYQARWRRRRGGAAS